MKILVVGLGSMGRRRIRLLKKLISNVVIFGVDNSEIRRSTVESTMNIKTFLNLEDIFEQERIDCAFVCTSPISHAQIIKTCLSHEVHVFSEINLISEGYEENIELAKTVGKVLFLSSTFLYREEIKYIKNKVNLHNKPLNYLYHIGQYLPDWHPWEQISDFFVSDIRTNGCREIFAIELPWLVDTFGAIINIHTIKRSISELEINYPDSYLVALEHEDGHVGGLAVDIVSRRPVRDLEIYGEELYLKWLGSGDSLEELNIETKKMEKIQVYESLDLLKEYSDFVVENAYLEEIKLFFDVISGTANSIYSFEEDAVILDIIDRIEGI